MTMLDTQAAAIRTRDIINRQVQKAINESGLMAKTGIITEINRDNNTAKVKFRNEDIPVLVKMGAIQPTAVGQAVRVSGPGGAAWIIDVIGRAAVNGAPSDLLLAPQGFTVLGLAYGFVATWGHVTYNDGYELQVATNAGFTIELRSFQTLAYQYIVSDLDIGTTYYIRVRALTSSGGVGPWSTVLTVVPPGYPSSALSDGFPPSSSPAVTCSAGMGIVFASWSHIPNADMVTYEVYADLESGFTPSPATKLIETTGNFYALRKLANGTILPYDNNTFVRVIAKDNDGAAPAGAQGFAKPDKIDSDDFGSVSSDRFGDGLVPANSPSDFTISAGIGYLFLTWAPVVNPDQVKYEIHMSTGPVFTPTANTLVAETLGAFFFLRTRPPGMGGGSITYDTTYYIKIWAKDTDGYAPTPSPVKVGTSIKTASTDISNGAIGTLQLVDLAVVSAKIADLAVGSGKIQDAAITTAHIINGAITNAKIANLSVDAAKIANLAVGTAQISDAAITNAKIANLNADKVTAGILTGIQIVGNTINGNTITGGTIIGALIRSAVSGPRVELQAGASSGTIFYYSGASQELVPGYVEAGYGTDPYGNPSSFLTLAGPRIVAGLGPPVIEMWQRQSNGSFWTALYGGIEIRTGGYITCPGDERVSIGVGDYIERLRVALTLTRMFYSAGNAELRLQTDGDVVIYTNFVPSWSAGTSISDVNHKKNVASINPAVATEMLRDIPLIEYEFLDESLPQGVRMGVSAQDIEAVYPQGISDVDGTKLLDISSMLCMILGAVKNLDTRILALETP
jgi:hypothetical protein